MSAPKKKIDPEEVRKLAKTGATQAEIASRMGVSLSTLQRRCGQDLKTEAALRDGLNEMKVALRTKQVQVALAGNVTMLIWLGKQYLGQKDNLEVTGETIHSLDTTSLSAVELLSSRIAELAERGRPKEITIETNGIPS